MKSIRIHAMVAAIAFAAIIPGVTAARAATLATDDFEDGDSSSWQTFSGGWQEANGVYSASNTNANTPVASVLLAGYGWTDYIVEADVTPGALTFSSAAGVVFRFQEEYPALRFCQCALNAGAGQIRLNLSCLTGGVNALIPFSWSPGQTYRLRGTAQGQRVTCEVVGVLGAYLEATGDGGIPAAGTAGLRGTHIPADFDNFVVTTFDADGDGVPDDVDNCPDDSNPFETCDSGADCLGPTNSCDVVLGECIQQDDNDGDGQGDVCDPDDDNDGIGDTADNCPIDANSDQADDDFDGLGNVCDATFDNGTAADHVEDEAATAVELISAAAFPGANGLISKLIGNGGVTKKVANAVESYDAGLIDLATYLAELSAALDKLDAFDNQLAAKISNGQFSDPEASAVVAASGDIRSTIESLIANAS